MIPPRLRLAIRGTLFVSHVTKRAACYKGEGPVKYLADMKLGRATVTIAITVVSFALLWLVVTAIYALR